MDYFNEFPSHTHAWAQSDRYALALGFVNNNLNFFKPETYVLNHQFPDDWKVPSKVSITVVDFPIHDYIPAILMKVTGIKSVWIFRLYILLYSLIGLFFLYKLSLLLSNDFIKSIFVLLFASTSPVFVYYQGGFLPTIPSLSNTIIGIFFYINYLKNSKERYFTISIIFLTLATLSRMTFAIPLLSVFGLELLRILKMNSKLKLKILPVIISILTITFFYFYNGYLRNIYGSIFLNQFLPAKNIQQVIEILIVVKDQWLFQYFTKVHYILLGIILLTYLILFLLKRIKHSSLTKEIFLLIGIMFLGCLSFTVLMLRQFPAHDYYFLDTFFLPIIIFLLLVLTLIPIQSNKKNLYLSVIFIVLVSIPFILNAYNSQKNRHDTGYWDRTNSTINNYKNSSKLLDSLNISKQSKILVIDAYAPNIPFILMDRKGYAIMTTSKENIENALLWDFDYITIQNEFFLSDIYSEYPEVLKRIYKLADNGKISVCRYSKNVLNQSLQDFIGISGKEPVFKTTISYESDTLLNGEWQNTKATDDFSFSGKKSGVLDIDMTYGITFKTKDLPIITEKNCFMYFSSCFLHDTTGNCEIVISINENGQNIFYKSTNLRNILKNRNEWEQVNLMFQLPIVNDNNYEFALFIWNTGKTRFFIDDFGFELY